MGKGLNQVDADCYNAWGSEYNGNYDYYNDDYSNWGNCIGYVSMLLEKGETAKTEEKGTIIAGDYNGLIKTRRARPIDTCNRFDVFSTDNDSDDDIDDDTGTAGSQSSTCYKTKRNPDQRQRRRHKEFSINTITGCTTTRHDTTQQPPQQFSWRRGRVEEELSVGCTAGDATIGMRVISKSDTDIHNTWIDKRSTEYMKHMRIKTHR